MNKDLQIQIIETVFAGLEKQKIKQDADGITYQIDADRYSSKERLAKEQETIF